MNELLERAKDLSRRAVDKWGEEAQLFMVIEECSELVHALMKHRRDQTPERSLAVMEEAADVYITLALFRLDESLLSSLMKKKLDRLEQRLNGATAGKPAE